MTKLPLILASASPRRVALLRQLGLGFQIIPSEAVEINPSELTARETCQVNAYRKARAVSQRYPNSLVLGADTLVHLGERRFGKPANLAEASTILEELQGNTHQVTTGVCLLAHQGKRRRIFAETTAVTFRPLDRPQIQSYLESINPLDKAGAYAIQEHGNKVVESYSGSFSNVVGLPLERLEMELKHWANLL